MSGSEIGDFLAWWLAFLLLGLVAVGPLRRDQGAAQAYLLTTLLHILAAAIYYYVPGVLPQRGDTHAFHNYAVARQWADEWSFAIGSGFYKEYLAQVYAVVGPSFFFGAMLSVVAFSLSVIVFVKFMEILDVKRGKGLAVLLFGGLPTAVLYGTVPMREPYQILFFMLACYSIFQFRMSSQPLYLMAGLGFTLLMGFLHKGLIIYAPFLVVIMLIARAEPAHAGGRSTTSKLYFHRLTGVALLAALLAGLPAAVGTLEGSTEVLHATAEGSLLEFAEEHRDDEALTKGRTAYGVALDSSSPVALVMSSVTIFLYYMFTPFPWQVRNFLDLYAFGEVVMRIVLLMAIFRAWRRTEPPFQRALILLMTVYLSMAFLWAAGTTNYGTATRHHMLHQWILLMLGVPALLHWFPLFGRSPGEAAARPQTERSAPVKRRTWQVRNARPLAEASPAPVRLDGARGGGPEAIRGASAPRRLAGVVTARVLEP